MTTTTTSPMVTVKEIVTADHRAAAVFERYAIDFCCNGGKPLERACAERGLDPGVVIRELHELGKVEETSPFRPDKWDLDALSDFIVNTHHRYVRRAIPLILGHMDKVLSAHGANHPELAGISERVHAVADELARHMQKEELILFPYIKRLVAADDAPGAMAPPPFGSIRNPIGMMEAEHRSAGDSFAFIRDASSGLTPPADACTTFRVTYAELAEFERDLHQHIHLENNILFPKAIALEERILSRT
jgi:regulator of cell morphogenesis and NO signaling